MAHHISIFLENKPGKLERITEIMYVNSINIRAFSVASAGEFGVIKFLVDDPEKAVIVLKENRLTVSLRKILIVLVEDKPGGFHRLLALLSSNSINIDDGYGFILEAEKKAAVVIEADEYPHAERLLKENGFELLSDDQIYSL